MVRFNAMSLRAVDCMPMLGAIMLYWVVLALVALGIALAARSDMDCGVHSPASVSAGGLPTVGV